MAMAALTNCVLSPASKIVKKHRYKHRHTQAYKHCHRHAMEAERGRGGESEDRKYGRNYMRCLSLKQEAEIRNHHRSPECMKLTQTFIKQPQNLIPTPSHFKHHSVPKSKLEH